MICEEPIEIVEDSSTTKISGSTIAQNFVILNDQSQWTQTWLYSYEKDGVRMVKFSADFSELCRGSIVRIKPDSKVAFMNQSYVLPKKQDPFNVILFADNNQINENPLLNIETSNVLGCQMEFYAETVPFIELDNTYKVVDFLSTLELLDDAVNIMEAIDMLFDKIENLIDSKNYSIIDTYILFFIERKFSFHLHVGMLASTFRIKNSLKNRTILFDSTFTIGLRIMQKHEVESTINSLK